MRKLVTIMMATLLGLGSMAVLAKPQTSTPASGKATSASTRPDSTVNEVMKQIEDENGKIDKKKENKLSPKALAKVAQIQLDKLSKYAMGLVKPQLEKKGTFQPVAAMVYRDGRINQLEIKSDKVPPIDKIRMYRIALRSLARHYKIDASIVIFSAEKNKNSKDKVIIMNYEHRFGVSGSRVIGYRFQNGKLLTSKPKDSAKPFFVFYDQNKVKGAGRTEGSKL